MSACACVYKCVCACVCFACTSVCAPFVCGGWVGVGSRVRACVRVCVPCVCVCARASEYCVRACMRRYGPEPWAGGDRAQLTPLHPRPLYAQVVRSSSPPLMWCVYAGCLLLVACTYVIMLPASSSSCLAVSWMEHLGTALCIYPLLLKNIRYVRVALCCVHACTALCI